MRNLLLFGNGLGRAIDNDFFQLSSAIESVWGNHGFLSERERELISSCIPGLNDPSHPSGEDEMLNSQLAIQSVSQLSESVNEQVLNLWLTPEAQQFSLSLENFISHIARYFHNAKAKLPKDFADPLVNFINKTRSHVVVLNYDPLLYDLFCKKHNRGNYKLHLCNDFEGDLVDGFTRTFGFSGSNFPVPTSSSPGYLLHLHGSPIFGELRDRKHKKVGQPDYIKLTREQLRSNRSLGKHIVLTHGSEKMRIIQASGIMSLFWEKFQDALMDALKITLFGYSGLDDHLNAQIKRLAEEKPKLIVERISTGNSLEDRQDFWEARLGENVEVKLLPNVLSFSDW